MRLQVFRMDLTAVLFYYPVTDAQAQTRTFANRFGRVEGIKYAI